MCSLQGALGGAAERHSRRVKPIEANCLSSKLFFIRKNLSPSEPTKLLYKVTGFSALESNRYKRLVKTAAVAGSTESKELALLWFKHDLRLDDHPGVAAASAYKEVLPVYVFDPHVCAG